ncbi:MAG: hypothetical protein JXC36_08730 [Candidatus Atribacteria bacterium]|nr:hypothetical protein [Candidatus Atribacteria bacterium]
MEDIGHIFSWLKGKDLPNYVCLILSAIIIPLINNWWKKREVGNIPNLQISLSFGTMGMGNQQYPCINIKFLNNTTSSIYLLGVRLLKASKLFKVSPNAEKNSADGSYILRFPNSEGILSERQVALDTNKSASTCLALMKVVDGITEFNPSFFCKLIHWRKYFILKYTALVGEKLYRVSFIY